MRTHDRSFTLDGMENTPSQMDRPGTWSAGEFEPPRAESTGLLEWAPPEAATSADGAGAARRGLSWSSGASRAVESGSPSTAEARTERRASSGLPAAVWVGLAGSALLTFAVLGVVIGRWDSIGTAGRAAGLTSLSLAIFALAVRLRKSTPVMAEMFAHLDGVLIGASGVSIMSAFGFGWPACLVVGGAVGAAAAVGLDRHWAHSHFIWLEVAGVAVAGFGLAALLPDVPITVGVVVSIVALIESGLRRFDRSLALALVATTSPLLSLLTTFGLGAGTLVEAGAAGKELMWSGPIVGVISAAVIFRAARGMGRRDLDGLAVAVAMAGLITGLLAADTNAVAIWCSLPGAALMTFQAMRSAVSTERIAWLSTASDIAVAFVGVVICAWAIMTVVIGAIILHGSVQEYWVPDIGPTGAQRVEWMGFPALFCLLGLGLWGWRTRSGSTTQRFLAQAGLGVAAPVLGFSIGLRPEHAALIAASLAVASARFGRPREVVYAIGGFAVVLAGLQVRHPGLEWVAAAELVAVVVGVVAGCTARAVERTDTADIELSVVGVVAAALIGWYWPGGDAMAAMLLGAAIVGAAQVAIDRSAVVAQSISVGFFGVVAVLVLDLRTSPLIGSAPVPWLTIGFAGAAASAWFGWLRTRRQLSAALASALSVGVVAAAGIEMLGDVAAVVVVLAALGIVITGIGALVPSHLPFTVAGLTAATIAMLLVPAGMGWMVSLLVVIVGAEVLTWGVRLGERRVVVGGAVLSSLGAISLLWTTPAIDALERILGRFGATPADLMLFVATATMLIIGGVVRRVYGARRGDTVTSWLAFGPGLTVGWLWLLSVAIDRTTMWVLPLGLFLGIGSLVTGALGRMAAPMVLGTGIVMSLVVVSYRTYLGEVPMWVWLGCGGAVLLSVGVTIERVSRSGMTLSDLLTRWD